MQSGMANAALPTYLKSTRKQSKITAERARKHNSVHVLPGKQLVKNSESPRAMALGKQLWKNYLQTESSLYGRQAKTGPEVNQYQRRTSKGKRMSEFERHRPFELPPVSMLGKNTPSQVRRSEKKKAAPYNNFKNTGKVSSRGSSGITIEVIFRMIVEQRSIRKSTPGTQNRSAMTVFSSCCGARFWKGRCSVEDVSSCRGGQCVVWFLGSESAKVWCVRIRHLRQPVLLSAGGLM